ncbi:MAG: hypothetical protein GY772_16545 [bacterium]|nr:hypothetical protein [bacterium]
MPPARRKRKFGGGRRVKAAAVGEELFAWFVDTISNVKGRIPSSMLLQQAQVIVDDLKRFHELRVENGEIPPNAQGLGAKLDVPVINSSWLRSWRRLYGVSWRSVNLRFKCPRHVLEERLIVFWENCLRIRFLHHFAEPHGELVFEGFDQKPLWLTAASQDRTLALRGARKVAVKENVPMTRARFTAMTRCRWPSPPSDGKELAVLFKASGAGHHIRRHLHVPAGVLLQFQEKGSYRLRDVLEYLEWILDRSRAGKEASSQGRRVVYVMDWFSAHLDESIDRLVHEAGHAVLRIGGHLTGLVQVEDTHAHGPYSRHYKQRETEDAMDQLRLHPDRLPSTSRQTVMDRALESWRNVDHKASSQGFVADGLCGALDGSEDHLLSADVAPFWHGLGMPARRDKIRAEIEAAVRERNLGFDDYAELLQPYAPHAPLPEGAEACGAARINENDVDERSESTKDEGEEEPPPLPPPLGPPPAPLPPHVASGEEPGGQDDAAALSQDARGEIPAAGEATASALFADVSQRLSALEGALKGLREGGGDAMAEEQLQRRIRALVKSQKLAGDAGRRFLRARAADRDLRIRALRAKEDAEDKEKRAMDITLRLRKAEAEAAKYKSEEARLRAKTAYEEAQKEKATRVAAARAEEEEVVRRQLHFAGTLAARIRSYFQDTTAGEQRRKRCLQMAVAQAKQKVGLLQLAVPIFWLPSTKGMVEVSQRLAKRPPGAPSQAPIHASPDFAWTVFGKQPRQGADPLGASSQDARFAFRKSLQELLPGYMDVLGSRYGVKTLLLEAHHILDLAFLAAVYRYTTVLGCKFFRVGLGEWPPEAGWLAEGSAASHAGPAPLAIAVKASSQATPAGKAEVASGSQKRLVQ